MKLDKNNIKEKIELFVLGELDEKEHKDVLNHINDHKESREYYDQLRAIVKSNEFYNLETHFNKELSWQRLDNKILFESNAKIINYKFLFRIAASILIVLAFSIVYYFIRGNAGDKALKIAMHYVEAPLGSISKIILPDSTSVTLNAGSSLTYPDNYNKQDTRQVKLTGEAYFEVAENKNAPFVVKAKDIFIKALGTSFNVKAYEEEKAVEATLVEGIIQIIKEGEGNSAITLQPNQKASIFPDSKKANIEEIVKKNQEQSKELVKVNKIRTNDVYVQREINTELSTSWKEEEWIIQRQSLADLSKLLERRYNVKFEFDDSDIENFVFSGTLTDQTLELVLKALQLAAPIKYSVEKGKVYIEEDKSIKRDYQRYLRND